MTKEKRSFLEKITGSKKIDEVPEEANSMSVYANDEDDRDQLTMGQENSSQYEQNVSDYRDDGSAEAEGQLTIDVYQTDNEVVIKSTIAGVKPEDLDVSVNNDMITIRGERKNEEEVISDNYYYQECYWGSFSRSVVLPVDVISDKSEASLKNGILTIRLPKAETNKSKKIQVRGF